MLKKLNPDMNVFVLYRDLRTYGERELLYKQAREQGVIFIRYTLENKPQVIIENGKLFVKTVDHVIGRTLEIAALHVVKLHGPAPPVLTEPKPREAGDALRSEPAPQLQRVPGEGNRE